MSFDEIRAFALTLAAFIEAEADKFVIEQSDEVFDPNEKHGFLISRREGNDKLAAIFTDVWGEKIFESPKMGRRAASLLSEAGMVRTRKKRQCLPLGNHVTVSAGATQWRSICGVSDNYYIVDLKNLFYLRDLATGIDESE